MFSRPLRISSSDGHTATRRGGPRTRGRRGTHTEEDHEVVRGDSLGPLRIQKMYVAAGTAMARSKIEREGVSVHFSSRPPCRRSNDVHRPHPCPSGDHARPLTRNFMTYLQTRGRNVDIGPCTSASAAVRAARARRRPPSRSPRRNVRSGCANGRRRAAARPSRRASRAPPR